MTGLEFEKMYVRFEETQNCMLFYLVNKFLNPWVSGYYNGDHIICKKGNNYFDITGTVEPSSYLPFREFGLDLILKQFNDILTDEEKRFFRGCYGSEEF